MTSETPGPVPARAPAKPMPSMTEEQRRDWAAEDQKMRTRRYLRRIAIRILAVPFLFLVPHSWVPFVIVIAVIAGLSAVIGGNDPDSARDFMRDDGTIIPQHHDPPTT